MISVDAVYVGTRLPACLEYPKSVRDKVAGLLGKGQPGVRETEDPDIAIQKRLALGWAAPDVIVFTEDDQVALRCQGNPFWILDSLSALLTIYLGKRVDDEAGVAQRRRKRDLAQAAIDQKLRRRP